MNTQRATEILDKASEAASEGRTIFALDTPIFYIIGWLVVAYFAVYFITFYAGPMLFGSRPYQPFGPYARSMQHVSKRAIQETESPDFVSRVLSSIENF